MQFLVSGVYGQTTVEVHVVADDEEWAIRYAKQVVNQIRGWAYEILDDFTWEATDWDTVTKYSPSSVFEEGKLA